MVGRSVNNYIYVDAKGISTYYEYDSMNKLIRKRAPSTGNEMAVTIYIRCDGQPYKAGRPKQL